MHVDFPFVHLLRVILFLVSSAEEVPEDVVESEQEIVGVLHDGGASPTPGAVSWSLPRLALARRTLQSARHPSELGVGGGRGRRPSAPDRPALLTSRPGQRDTLLPAVLPWQREGGRRQVRL